MSLKFSVLALVFLAAGVGVLATAVSMRSAGRAAASAPAPAGAPAAKVEASPAPPRRVAALTPPGPRAGRRLPLEEAIRALDLIRPSRQKLADDWTLPTASATRFRLSEQRGKVVLVNFWATWCPPCIQEMPAMERLYRQHRGAGFVLVGVSVDADPGKVTPFMTKLNLTFPAALDSKMELADRYGVRALPSSFVVDRNGYLVALALGPRAWDGDAAHSLVEALVR